jgi:hypothetical protein
MNARSSKMIIGTTMAAALLAALPASAGSGLIKPENLSWNDFLI